MTPPSQQITASQTHILESLAQIPTDLVPIAAQPALPVADSILADTIPAKTRTRLGKIARLPQPHRDLVNRMLRNNIPHQKIVSALDELQVKVTQRNISNWKTRGGYEEWCRGEDHAVQLRLLQDNLTQFLRKREASQVPEVGLQLAATHLSQFFFRPEALRQLASEPEKYSRLVATLCRLATQIHTLQKHRDDSAKELGHKHNPERIRQQNEEEIERIRQIFSATIPENSTGNYIPHRNSMPKT